MDLIRKLPVPISGLMLALAATGNLLSSYGSIYRYPFGIAAAILLVLLVIKAVILPKSILEGFENPVVASVMPTFSMTLMLLSTYVKPLVPSLAFLIWVIGLLLHIVMLLCFTAKYMFSFNIQKVFPSYFIVYVGIICGSITAPAFGLTYIGQYIFWFGFAAYLGLLPVILHRLTVVKEIPEAAAPTMVILTAPSSLCLAGYLNCFQDKSSLMVAFLGILSVIALISVLACMPRLLKLKFYPSYSAFTFPFVITAIAMKGSYAYFSKAGLEIVTLRYFSTFLEIFSVSIVIYVLIRYLDFLFPGILPGSAGRAK